MEAYERLLQPENLNYNAYYNLKGREKQRLHGVELYEPVLFFREQKYDRQNQPKTANKIGNVAEHGPHI